MRARHLVVVLLSVVAVLASMTAPASAAPAGPRPQVSVGGLSGPIEGPEGRQEWNLSVDAVDPDGVIWEVVVRWDDRSITFATTFCLQGGDPGTPAHLEIPHSFPGPGRYRVQVEATSVPACFGGGDGTEQTTHPVTRMVTVPS